MNIKNKPVINRDPQSALISQLKQRVYELEVENRKLRNITNKNNIDEILGDKKSLRDSKYEDGNDNSDAIKKNNINL
jgi:molybdopterin converting factor small subunit